MTISIQGLGILALAASGAALVNGLVGFGFALLAVNAMALAVGAKEAVLIMSLMAPVMSGLQLIHHRHHRPPWRRLRGLLAGALLGTLAGARVFVLLSPAVLALALGTFTVGYAVSALRSDRPAITSPVEARLSPIAGFVGGFSNGTLGASGPVFGSYLTAIGLRGRDFAAAISALFLGMGVVRMAQLAAFGQYDGDTVFVALALLAPSIAFQRVGFWIRRRISTTLIYRGVLILLLLAGMTLLGRGLSQLL